MQGWEKDRDGVKDISFCTRSFSTIISPPQNGRLFFIEHVLYFLGKIAYPIIPHLKKRQTFFSRVRSPLRTTTRFLNECVVDTNVYLAIAGIDITGFRSH